VNSNLELIKKLEKIGLFLGKFYFKLLEDNTSITFYIYNLFSFTVITISVILLALDLFNIIPESLDSVSQKIIDFATFLIAFEWIGRFILVSDFWDDFQKACR
jgi:hypothetical protein